MWMGSDEGGNNKKYIFCSDILHLVLGPRLMVVLEPLSIQRGGDKTPVHFPFPHLPALSCALKHGFPFPKNPSPKLFSFSPHTISLLASRDHPPHGFVWVSCPYQLTSTNCSPKNCLYLRWSTFYLVFTVYLVVGAKLSCYQLSHPRRHENIWP